MVAKRKTNPLRDATRKRPPLRDATDQPIHRAAADDTAELLRILDSAPELRDERGWFWRQPIHSAAKAGNAPSLEVLLKRGADPNAQEGLHLETPLFHAVESDSLACVKLLLDAGAEPNKPRKGGKTPCVFGSVCASHPSIGECRSESRRC
jgi:ankyrin repeat protein